MGTVIAHQLNRRRMVSPSAQNRAVANPKAAEGHQDWAGGTRIGAPKAQSRLESGKGSTKGSGERPELPQRNPGQSPVQNAFSIYFWVTEHFWQTENAIFCAT